MCRKLNGYGEKRQLDYVKFNGTGRLKLKLLLKLYRHIEVD